MARKSAQDLLDELEKQFHAIQNKMTQSRSSYVANHQNDYQKARQQYQKQKKKLEDATRRVGKEADNFRKTGTKVAQNQMKKAAAAAAILGEALGEAKGIMTTAEDNLNSAKPFDKKLKARSKALAAFEKDWDKKQKDAEKAKQARAKKRKATVNKKA